MKTGFPSGSEGKESACNTGNLGSIARMGRFPGEKNGNPLQYSYLENSVKNEWIFLIVPDFRRNTLFHP